MNEITELNNMNMSAKKRYKKVPPEGGWGFLVLLGLAIFLVGSMYKNNTNRIMTN